MFHTNEAGAGEYDVPQCPAGTSLFGNILLYFTALSWMDMAIHRRAGRYSADLTFSRPISVFRHRARGLRLHHHLDLPGPGHDAALLVDGRRVVRSELGRVQRGGAAAGRRALPRAATSTSFSRGDQLAPISLFRGQTRHQSPFWGDRPHTNLSRIDPTLYPHARALYSGLCALCDARACGFGVAESGACDPMVQPIHVVNSPPACLGTEPWV